MTNTDLLLKYKLHHLFFWLMLFGLWYFLRYEDYSTTARAFRVTLIKVTDLAIMVYITNYLLIPAFLYKRKYLAFAFTFVLMVVVSSAIKMNILGRLLDNPTLLDLTGNLKARIYDNVIPHFFLVLSGAAVKLMMDYTRMQQRMVEMAKEKAEAELNFLKSQINPHFLFNSLNSVYFLIEKNNTGAREALHKFSAMLRYQLYEMNGDKIPIEKEMQYLEDYVDLQKLRKDEHYAVEFNRTGDLKGFAIEPLLLVPFVENAFKHISHHKDQLNFIKLDLEKKNGTFYFKLENSKEAGAITTDKHAGIGLNNVKRRLELLYPGTHQLTITNGINTFNVKLELKIKN
ncbi:MAG TPA: histidine kinase [Ferruginibacter sp.]|nr:histidine kinase [Ferruginibacter sp.]